MYNFLAKPLHLAALFFILFTYLSPSGALKFPKSVSLFYIGVPSAQHIVCYTMVLHSILVE